MPNWCSNYITITGSKEDIAALKTLASDGFDFDKIMPMPDGIDSENCGRTAGNTTVVVNESSGIFHLANGGHGKLDFHQSWDLKVKGGHTVADAINNGYKPCKVCVVNPKMRGQGFDKPIEEGAALVKEFGYDNWWDWRVNKWGTKWTPEIDPDWGDTFMTANFETAWSPPEGIYKKLVELFPALDIKWHWSEPGMCASGDLETDTTNDFADKCECDDPQCGECHPENYEE